MKKITVVLTYILALAAANSLAASPQAFIKNNVDGSQTLRGHLPKDVASATFMSHADQSMNVSIILPLANQSQLNSFLQDLYDPKSPMYHRFLTPAEFNQQFYASSVDSALVKEYLNKEGISVAGQSPNGSLLYVTGPSRAFEHAFGLHINKYRKKNGTKFYAPDADPTIPATLAGKILAMGGLDDLHKYHAHSLHAPMNASPNAFTYTPIGSGPGGYLAPNDLKTAYNLNTVPAVGTGQNIALFELDGYSSSDITAYESYFSLPNVPLQITPIDGFNEVPDYDSGGAVEVTLDIELVTAFAPGTSNILVYEAPNTTYDWMKEWTQIANDDKAKVISCSWGQDEQDSPTISSDNSVFQQMAAQGQAVFVASGDSGAYANCDNGTVPPNCTTEGFPATGIVSAQEPAVQPFATAVGISVLKSNPDGTYNSETASIYGGGGISVNQKIPSYQTTLAAQALPAAMVSTTMRNEPDLVLTADQSTPHSFYINGVWDGWWGSSLAAPIWASFVSLIDQGLGQNGPLGSVNQSLYTLAQSNPSNFHDITTGNNSYYPAEPGFDDATGLGSMNGLNLYNNLVPSGTVTPPSIPTGLSATAGISQVTLSWNAVSGATSYIVKRSLVNGGPYSIIASPVLSTTFTDNSFTSISAYYYVVSALNAGGQSLNSTQVNATPIPPPSPLVPGNVTATTGDNQVTLTWTASQGDAAYTVGRSTINGGPYTTVAFESLPQHTKFIDSAVTDGTTYYYVVSAMNLGGQSPDSAQVSATPLPLPLPPTGLQALGQNNQVTLTWTASTGASSYYITRSPYYGSFQTVPNSYVDTSVSNGNTYCYSVEAINSTGSSQDSVTVCATPTPTGPGPLAPTGLIATAGNGQVTLSWNASNEAINYHVERSTISGGPYTYVDTVPSPNTAYTDYSVNNGTPYYYVVIAIDGNLASPYSAQVSVTPEEAPGAPLAPTGLSATAGNNQVALTWNASAGATLYNVLRATTSGGPYVPVGVPSSNTAYTDNSLNDGTTYYYVVVAINGSGTSPYSAQVSATPGIPAPLAPTGLTATAGNDQVALTWNASAGATFYNVLRSTISGGPYVLISSGSLNDTAYTDFSVNNGTTYYYVVNAVGYGTSPNSAQVSATPQAPTLQPSAPTNLTATPGNAQVALSWTASTGATSYNVLRSTTNGGPYASIASSIATNSYTDFSAINGDIYYYVVTAVNASGQSGYSNQVSAVPDPPPPLAPANLISTPGNAQVLLSWSGSTGAASYNILRSTISGGPYTTIATAVGTINYTDTSLVNGTTYYYVVEAVNVGGFQSGYSNQTSATPEAAAPAAPTNLTATAGNDQVTLTWTASVGAISYVVARSTSQSGPYITITDTITSANYADTSVVNGTTYYYFVEAANAGGTSGMSNTASATPQASAQAPAAPTNLTAVPGLVNATTVELGWTASAGATSYKVLRSATSGGPYTTIAGSVAVNTYVDISVVNGVTYYYVIQAVNASGQSGNSNQASITTVPLEPANVTATAGNAQVALSWTASAGSTSYNVLRSTTAVGPYTTIASPATNSYTDTTVVNGNTYYYLVEAVDAGGASGASIAVSATPQAPAQAPSAPTNLSAVGGVNQVVLSWNASSLASSYIVWRLGQNGATFISIASNITVTNYTDSNVTDGTAYYYVVTAVNSSGSSSSSNEVSATPIGMPSAPSNLSATAQANQVYLIWSGSALATSYDLYRSTTNGGPYTLISSGISGNTTTDTSVVDGTLYYYVVTAVNSVGQSGYSNQTSATPVSLPAAPANLTATGGNDQVALSWSTSNGASFYRVYRSTGIAGPYTAITGFITLINYTDTTAINGTMYYYEVAASNNFGQGPNSNPVSATPILPVPAAPTNLTAVPGLVNATTVELGWTASAGATSYKVLRSTISGGPYTTIAGSVAVNTYADISVVNGDTYYYVVQAVNTSGPSGNSNQAAITMVPMEPTNVTATAGNTQVALSWTASAGSTSYNVLRSTSGGGPFTNIASPVTNSYTDTTVVNGTIYYYLVEAVDAGGASGASIAVSATPQPPVPSPPIGLTASALQSSVSLSWNLSRYAVSYNMYRSTTKGGPYALIGNVTGTLGEDNGLLNNTTYYYVVTAVNTAGESSYSNEASATTQVSVPAAPTNLTAIAGNGQVTLSWTPSNWAASYDLYRSTTNGGPYNLITSGLTSPSATDLTVSNGTAYYYVVTAVNSGGQSGYSNQVSATPQAPVVFTAPSAPTNLSAVAGNAQVTLSWTASNGATSYSVLRSISIGGPYTIIASPVTNSYTDTSPVNGTTYYYLVEAIDAGGTSGISNTASATPQAPVTTVPQAPSSLVGVALNNQVILAWLPSKSALSYNIKRSTTNKGPYTTIASGIKINIYQDRSVSVNTTYYYVVTAVNNIGESPISNQISVTPRRIFGRF